ncbi:MAG TPA: phosphate acyltransferase PlsX [Trueperaceae bacterium]|nr:phosphate acyltransferase PlsX [Trueperaceae bacterium]
MTATQAQTPRLTPTTNATTTIALDAMGGDNMPGAAVAGAIAAVSQGSRVILVGDEGRVREELELRRASGSAQAADLDTNLEVVHAGDVISMDDHAADVRRRKDSSVMVAMRLVSEGRAAAAVSLGHSGATMAAALLTLGRLAGVERPAILANIPTKDSFVALLDVGANADAKPTYLQQFAVLGSAYVSSVWQRHNPSVGLMSIGEEAHKGNELTRTAHELLKATPGINFYGNVEGRDLLRGVTDVVVTDGFTGNVMLKLAEGEAREIFTWMRDALSSSLRAKLGGLLVRPALRAIAKRMDPSEYGAQPLLGVNGYAFIGHGSADARAVTNAVRTADRAVAAGALERTKRALADLAG